VENNIILTYFNKSYDEFTAFTGNPENLKSPDGLTDENDHWRHVNAALVLFLVSSFDDGTADSYPLTRDGLVAMERDWPGTLPGIVKGYHQSRAASVEKN
jgi:hypothetical protein